MVTDVEDAIVFTNVLLYTNVVITDAADTIVLTNVAGYTNVAVPDDDIEMACLYPLPWLNRRVSDIS